MANVGTIRRPILTIRIPHGICRDRGYCAPVSQTDTVDVLRIEAARRPAGNFWPDDARTMISTRRSLNFTAPLVLEPPSHCGLFPIALVPGRHLIGSADDCDIRLSFAGIASRHAIVMVGENRTIVKSMDSRSWVNDSPIAEMALRSGDRLSIGPVTFRVRSATKDEVAAFETTNSDAGAQVHRVDLPVATTPDPVQTPVSGNGNPQNDGRISQTDAVFAVIEVPPLSAHAIDHQGHRSDEASTRNSENPRGITSVSLDDRLGEIQQRLAELELNHVPVSQPVEPLAADANLWAQSLQAREQELLRRVEQVAVDTEHLQERAARLATQEAHLDARQQQLAGEAKRIADIAESTRCSLAEEHAQHLTIWKEWEVAYQRMAGDVANQTEAINRQRETLQTEADRLSSTRSELQRTRVVHEQNRKDFGADQASLANERAEILALKTRFEAQRHQHQLEVAEQRRQIDAAKREIDLKRGELNTSLQQLEHERQLVMTDRLEQIRRVEQDNQRRTSLYSTVEEERERLRIEREEFALLKVGFEQRQAIFERESLRAETARVDAAAIIRERNVLLDRCQYLELSIANRSASSLVAVIDGPSTASEHSAPTAPLSTELAQQSLSDIASPDQVIDPIANEVTDAEVNQPRYDTFDPWPAGVPLTTATCDAIASETPPLPPLPTAASSDGTWDASLERIGVLQTIDSALVEIEEQPAPFPHDSNPTMAERSDPSSEGNSHTENQNVWGDLTVFGLGTEVPVSSAPPADFSPPLTGIDPWGAFVPIPSIPMEPPAMSIERQSAGGTTVKGVRKAVTTETGEVAASPAPHVSLTVEQDLSADETMEVVNRQFGVPVEEIASTPTAGALPSWWVENAPSQTAASNETFKVEQPNWVTEALKADSTEPEQKPVVVTEAGDDLRSKLAMLFDLPAVEADQTSSESPQETGDTVPVAREELAAMVDDLAAKGEETPSESNSTIQDSVDEFMARLLARSRGDEAKPLVVNKAPVPTPPVQDTVSFSLPAEPDRSHLMAEPKHKQDKQAVRENLQSFRKVAHMSARSALARHSLQQLRNATIAKGILLGASTIAMTWFFARPLFGSEFQMWKAGACGLASLLSGVEFHRSWSQLFKPITAPANVAVPEAAEVPTSDAAIEVTVDAPETTTEPHIEPAEKA
ncbi:MAG: Forkhead-associated protein [Schlesneria sp.]|nr:Forkhead-associated protein [Schlesneria sp.]